MLKCPTALVTLQNERLKDELRGYKEECDLLADQVEDVKK